EQTFYKISHGRGRIRAAEKRNNARPGSSSATRPLGHEFAVRPAQRHPIESDRHDACRRLIRIAAGTCYHAPIRHSRKPAGKHEIVSLAARLDTGGELSGRLKR